MYFLALYNLDRFKDFIFYTTFLKRFELEKSQIDKIKSNDEELLKFAFNWIKFSLFGEKTVKIKSELLKK